MSKKNAVEIKPVGGPGDGGFPFIGIGASAGGLDALKKFFTEVPEKSGMAYIVVVHLNPEQPSLMPELLQRTTAVPVAFAADGEQLEPDRVYVNPPNKQLSVFKGRIQLLDLLKRDVVLPIDYFFRSLAADREEKAAGIVLSGTGTDGTLGVRAIKGNYGLVLVQSLESAGYNGMPKSAVDSGIADAVLAPEEMPRVLIDYYSLQKQIFPGKNEQNIQKEEPWLSKLFAVLRTKLGHDFSEYKTSTILRRIQRRMGVNRIDRPERYIQYLRESGNEVEALFQDLLIGVTHFFRERESFDSLEKDVLPGLIENVRDGDTLRVWVPGCSTGEDAYSLAIILYEYLDTHPKQLKIQIFGTDIDGRAVDRSRQGLYPSSISADVGKERLSRFFTPEGEYYRIRKDIRDMVVFSVQDVIKDPPFSRINILCCRNLLIYLNSKVQQKILSLFHYTLKPGGILILGSSETVGQFTDLFHPIRSKLKIYKKKEGSLSARGLLEFPTGVMANAHDIERQKPDLSGNKVDLGALTKEAIAELGTSTAVLTDFKGNILYVHGNTGKYLETVSGPPSQNILDMARAGLRIELSSALRRVHASKKREVRKNIRVGTEDDMKIIELRIDPLFKPKELEGRYLVLFEEKVQEKRSKGPEPEGYGPDPHDRKQIQVLENELMSTRESHQTTIEELESSNEELKSTNEEMQSSNEELESSREELQSLNEELQTVNSELQNKVEELSGAHDDMYNLLNSTEVASIFVDNEIRIKRFTREAANLIRLIPTDVGRPLRDMVTNLEYDGMIEDIQEVIRDLIPKEEELTTTENVWYLMRILPYRTLDNRIDGAVITFINIDTQKKVGEQLERSQLLIRRVFDMSVNPMAVLEEAGQVVIANTAFSELMKVRAREIEGKGIFDEDVTIIAKSDLLSHIRHAVENRKDFFDIPGSVETDGKVRNFRISGQIILSGPNADFRLLIIFNEESGKIDE